MASSRATVRFAIIAATSWARAFRCASTACVQHAVPDDRQRLLKLWFDASRHELAGKRLLHFGPEPSVIPFIRPVAADYVSADLQAGRADRVLNIEAIDLPDACVDVVLCSARA